MRAHAHTCTHIHLRRAGRRADSRRRRTLGFNRYSAEVAIPYQHYKYYGLEVGGYAAMCVTRNPLTRDDANGGARAGIRDE